MTILRFQIAEGAQSWVQTTVSPRGLGMQGVRPGPKLRPGPRSPGAGAPGWLCEGGRGAARAPRLGGRGPRAGAGDAEVPGRLVGGAAPGERSRPRRPARAPGRSHAGAPLTGRSRSPRAPLCASRAPASGGEETGTGRARGRGRRPARLAPELGWEPSARRAPPVWRPPGCLLRPHHHRVSRLGSLCPAGARGAPRGASCAASLPPSRIS